MKDKQSSIKIQYIIQNIILVALIASCSSRNKSEQGKPLLEGNSESSELILSDTDDILGSAPLSKEEVKDPLKSAKSSRSKNSRSKVQKGNSKDRNYKKSFVTMMNPYWFKTLEKFKLKSETGDIQTHMFYDVLPRFEKNKNTLNFVVTTPEGSEYGNDLDLASGQLFVNRKFCPHPDAYEKTPKDVYKPPFTMGIVPRVFDQLNEPQKIIVFGDKDYYQEFYRTNFFEARIIGAYIEQICPSGTCLEADDWLSRLVLVGVKPDSDKFADITNVDQMFTEVDWQKVIAFIENGNGSNLLADNTFPAYRMGALIDASQALYFLGENSVVLGNDQLKTIRKSCYKLYEYLYRYLNLDKENFKEDKNVITKNKIYVGDEKRTKNDVNAFKTVEKTLEFHQRFVRTFIRYNEQYKTCIDYIYPTNINHDASRHWFFAYYSAFHRLHDLGYYFDCGRQNWVSNPFVAKNKRSVSVEDQFRGCSAGTIDKGFQNSVLFLDNLKNKRRETYRYIDYDNYPFGTHEKIYNWVKFDNKFLKCNEDSSKLFFRDRLKSFPKDIKWIKREKKQSKTKAGVIIE